MDLVFVHGWGSGPFIWQHMSSYFSEHKCHIVNLGFLGEEEIVLPTGKFIGIGHSLGGLWLLKHYPQKMTGFVSIASFNCFYRHIPHQILSKMKKNVVKNTAQQLKDFWHYAGLDYPGGFMNLKPLKLTEGLGNLSTWNAAIPENLPLKILACRNDFIVSEKMTTDIWGQYPIEWIEDGGHMLPITQPQWCIDHIKNFTHDIQ